MTQTHGAWRAPVRSGGKVTIPAAIRRHLDAHPGDDLVFQPYGTEAFRLVKVTVGSEAGTHTAGRPAVAPEDYN